MRFTRSLYALIAVAFLLGSCKKKETVNEDELVPLADFNFSKPEYLAGETIELINTSANATNYRWTLPDGTTSRDQNVAYPTVLGLANYYTSFKLEAISKSGLKSDFVVKKVLVKQPKGQLIVFAHYYSSDNQGYLKIGEENKGLITVKKLPTSVANEPGCGEAGYQTYDVPVGPQTVEFVIANTGTVYTYNITVGQGQCTKLRLPN